MKKKLLSVMLVGALAISALTGCGSKETASDDSQKTGTTTEADSSSDAADTSDFDKIYNRHPGRISLLSLYF